MLTESILTSDPSTVTLKSSSSMSLGLAIVSSNEKDFIVLFYTTIENIIFYSIRVLTIIGKK